MKYTGRTSRNINIKALGLLLCILVASYGIIKAPASDTRIKIAIAVNICITYYGSGK